MCDQAACAFQKLSIFVAERVQMVTLHIQHAENVPVLIVFGCGLALIRARSDSVYPGMVVHAAFNAIALIVAVTT